MAKKKAAKKKAAKKKAAKKKALKAPLSAATARGAAPLDPLVVQAIVIRNTPNPGPATGVTQLQALGVVNSTTVGNHRAGIRRDIEALGRGIKESDIVSSPPTTVATCRNSVINNAT
jgi:membrane protein involved in colicin uptake